MAMVILYTCGRDAFYAGVSHRKVDVGISILVGFFFTFLSHTLIEKVMNQFSRYVNRPIKHYQDVPISDNPVLV